MAKLQKLIQECSQKYVFDLETYNKTFSQRITRFFTEESKKCLILETRDTNIGALRIKKIAEKLEPPFSDKYGGHDNQTFIKWECFLKVVSPRKLIPKFGNLLVLQFSLSEPEYDQRDILETVIERVNLVLTKKVVLIFNHQDCPDTFLRQLDVNGFLKIDEFNDKVTSLSDSDPTELLYEAAVSGRTNHVTALLNRGGKVNESIGLTGNTALHGAAENGDKNLVSLLLQNGALITKNGSGDTPLHVAVKHGQIDVVAKLLEYDNQHSNYVIDINSTNHSGRTALHLAADFDDYDSICILIKHGANVNCQDKDDCTPLHFAAAINRPSIVKLLIQKGAKPDLKNRWGMVPLDVARERGHYLVEEQLTLGGKASRRSVSLAMI